jgi:hypothetical protein
MSQLGLSIFPIGGLQSHSNFFENLLALWHTDFLFLLEAIYLVVGLLDPKIVLFWEKLPYFLKKLHTVFHNDYTIVIHTNSIWEFLFLLILFSTCYFLSLW